MPVYNKLVRDNIPGIIRKSGSNCETVTLGKEEFAVEVKRKLREEMEEYFMADNDSHSLEELADLLELVHAAAETHGSSFAEIEQIRLEKKKERGGFEERIFLHKVIDNE
ncbi:nucleoside triphosphate pyrophosphohydrolase [Pseudalkalibacillus caeni]|uniref:Phosphoribosyl-ATP pyrophosphohydrolase n=1 Tax=Exobacillus caeni TaxID=2574798 RepID=A0A5R9F2P2_9BACL|nr:nucleoside triphosphate pyrophosphohydrolase [Pseudalkalibacillus caeni]TLS37942.1 phosphoribosyl-ATP pyrophosphohydrolase [Pseudalkalibacillus caeni]